MVKIDLAIMEDVKFYISYLARIIEILGVLIIVTWTFIAFFKYLFSKRIYTDDGYKSLRHSLGKGILLGLEVLVAGDIIATVATEPTMQSVLILGVIVLIRTFLSFSLEIELNGHFPWQQSKYRSGEKRKVED